MNNEQIRKNALNTRTLWRCNEQIRVRIKIEVKLELSSFWTIARHIQRERDRVRENCAPEEEWKERRNKWKCTRKMKRGHWTMGRKCMYDKTIASSYDMLHTRHRDGTGAVQRERQRCRCKCEPVKQTILTHGTAIYEAKRKNDNDNREWKGAWASEWKRTETH